MHSSRAIRAFERRLFELGCPANYSQRSIAELAEHFEDLTQARIDDGLDPDTASARAATEIGQPAILAEQLVASFRQASWWGRHPVIGFCLLPPLALMLFLPATVLALYGLYLLGNLFSRHSVPLNEFKSAIETAPAAFVEWNDPLLCFIHSVPIAITTILFCKLVARSASGLKWLLTTCAVCSATGFFTWTGFSQSGFYLGYGSPSVHNWLSAAVPLFIAAGILAWRQRRLALIGPPDLERMECGVALRLPPHSIAVRSQAPISLPQERHESNDPLDNRRGEQRSVRLQQWFTPTSAVAAAVVVLSALFIKFIWLNDKVDHAKMETLRNRIWPAERKAVLNFLQMRQSVKDTVGEKTIPLLPFATALLTDPVCWFGKTNFATLADLPRGLHTFAGVPFAISERVQLMGNAYKELGVAFPSAIKGIPIHQKCSRLNILHGASFVRTKVPSVPDEKGFMPVLPDYETTNVPVARLVLHYADRRQAEIEIFSTQHLLDVWGPICTSEVSVNERSVSSPESELAWASSRVPQEKSEMLNSVRLYKSRFENPRPDAEIVTLDFISTRTEAAPFLLGLTIE
jgi:hypothetical protein